MDATGEKDYLIYIIHQNMKKQWIKAINSKSFLREPHSSQNGLWLCETLVN